MTAEEIDALAFTWAARITGEDGALASTAECICRHGYVWGECFECCEVVLRGVLGDVYAKGLDAGRGAGAKGAGER